MLAVLLACAFGGLVLDSIEGSLMTVKVDVPEDDPFCALSPGKDKTLVRFEGLATNTGETDLHSWNYSWILDCGNYTREGTIHLRCLNDFSSCEAPKFYSCAVSGVSPGCKTKVRPDPCEFIDITDAPGNCSLTIDGRTYSLSGIPSDSESFWVKFILCACYFVGVTIIAFISAVRQPAEAEAAADPRARRNEKSQRGERAGRG